MAVVGRLAPSPTGRLHLGHARSFLMAYWDVKRQGGSLLLRMDDLDQSRCRPAHADQIVCDLSWLGLQWQRPATSQWERRERLRAPAQTLVRSNQAYHCYCTRAELQALAAPHAGESEPRYPGTCSALAEFPARERSCVRLRVPTGEVAFVDELWGEQRVDVRGTVGDFTLLNRAGVSSYQLATVVDDSDSGVTSVVRGADLLESTARQVLIARALGYASPHYLHVPLVTDESGRRLAKRHDDLSLARLREMGATPASIVTWAARSAGMSCPPRLTASEAATYFDPTRLVKTASVVDGRTVATLCGRAP